MKLRLNKKKFLAKLNKKEPKEEVKKESIQENPGIEVCDASPDVVRDRILSEKLISIDNCNDFISLKSVTGVLSEMEGIGWTLGSASHLKSLGYYYIRMIKMGEKTWEGVVEVRTRDFHAGLLASYERILKGDIQKRVNIYG